MIDQYIDELKAVVRENGQPDAVATAIAEWLRALLDGDEDIGDKDQATRRAETIYQLISVSDQMVSAEESVE